MSFLVIGDSFSNRQPPGPQAWPELLAARLGTEVVNMAVPGSGYFQFGDYPSQPAPFSRQIQTAPPRDYGLVIVFGGYNDRFWDKNLLGMKAWTTLWMAQLRFPRARQLWIGPEWSGPSPCTTENAEARNAVRAAVWNLAFDRWRDPIAENWMPMNHPEWWTADRFHPNGPGHEHLCDMIEPDARALLGTV